MIEELSITKVLFVTGGGGLLTLAGWFLKDVISVNAKPIIEKHLKIDPERFGKKKKYFKALYNDLSKMPFVLHDFELDIESNYVNVIERKIDISTLQVDNKTSIHGDYDIKSFVLILGNAGIGKTTYTRNLILKIILNKTGVLNYDKHDLKRIIPIYVPLKIVDNSKKYPIISYILENNKYYQADYNKLLNDVKERKVLLFLDGYDEISTIANKNYIKEELILILGSGSYTYKLLYNDNYNDFYESVYLSKVWLTSRKEFYKSNLPIPLNHFTKYKENISGIVLEGVYDERIKLVDTLFNKYKKDNSKLQDLLNAEYFIHEINKSKDLELIALSKVPLFLTVMCYIYINDVKETSAIKINFLADYSLLINKFIELLLLELDQEKVKNETTGMKSAYLTRRNNFTNEKLQFIKYFAFINYDNKLNTFTIEKLKETAREFFKEQNDIVADLSNDNKDIIDEIINNGIFSFIGVKNKIEQYDFPHRKFKEVLGVQFLIDQNDSNFIINQICDGESYELSFEFLKKTSNKKDFVKLLLSNISDYDKSKNICVFLYEYCIINSELTSIITHQIEKELTDILENNGEFYLSKKLYQDLLLSQKFILYLVKNIVNNKNYKKEPFIALIFFNSSIDLKDYYIKDEDFQHLYDFFKYTHNKEIDISRFWKDEQKLKEFILSITRYNNSNIDENIFENVFLKIDFNHIYGVLDGTVNILGNQFKIFEIIQYKKSCKIEDFIFDIEQILIKHRNYTSKFRAYYSYFMSLYRHNLTQSEEHEIMEQLQSLETVNKIEVAKILSQKPVVLHANLVFANKISYDHVNVINRNFEFF